MRVAQEFIFISFSLFFQSTVSGLPGPPGRAAQLGVARVPRSAPGPATVQDPKTEDSRAQAAPSKRNPAHQSVQVSPTNYNDEKYCSGGMVHDVRLFVLNKFFDGKPPPPPPLFKL